MTAGGESLIRQNFDILVLGAGLAGLRAAWAALEENPGARVAIAAPTAGPSGSSFANIHDRLGMQVGFTDTDAADLAAEVQAVGRPGHVDSFLAEALAADSLARFTDMRSIGVPFLHGQDGNLALHSGCFSPRSRRAVIFEDLGATFRAFKGRIDALGGVFLPGLLARELLVVDGAARGAIFSSKKDDAATVITAEAVIMALGGPAPLFAWSQAGPRNPGWSYAMLERARVRMVNQGYLQYMWASVPSRKFWNLAQRAGQNLRVRGTDGGLLAPPAEILELAPMRGTHCPFGFGHGDAALDRFLLEQRGPDGTIEVVTDAAGSERIAPMAHAGNGGALIDAHGRTSLPGLYAVGECASGMHGANRVGGAMVLATQVFGARAGRHAAASLKNFRDSSDISLNELRIAQPTSDPGARERAKQSLALFLQKCVAMQKTPDLAAAMAEIRATCGTLDDWQAKLALEAGLTVMNHVASHN